MLQRKKKIKPITYLLGLNLKVWTVFVLYSTPAHPVPHWRPRFLSLFSSTISQEIGNSRSVPVSLSVLSPASGTYLANRRNSEMVTIIRISMWEKLKPSIMPSMTIVKFFKNNTARLKLRRDHFSQKIPLGKSFLNHARKQSEGPLQPILPAPQQ